MCWLKSVSHWYCMCAICWPKPAPLDGRKHNSNRGATLSDWEADFHTTSDLIWASDGGLQLCVFACIGTTWSLPSVKCVWADLSFSLHCLRLRFTWNCSVYEVKHVLGKYFNLCWSGLWLQVWVGPKRFSSFKLCCVVLKFGSGWRAMTLAKHSNQKRCDLRVRANICLTFTLKRPNNSPNNLDDWLSEGFMLWRMKLY